MIWHWSIFQLFVFSTKTRALTCNTEMSKCKWFHFHVSLNLTKGSRQKYCSFNTLTSATFVYFFFQFFYLSKLDLQGCDSTVFPIRHTLMKIFKHWSSTKIIFTSFPKTFTYCNILHSTIEIKSTSVGVIVSVRLHIQASMSEIQVKMHNGITCPIFLQKHS